MPERNLKNSTYHAHAAPWVTPSPRSRRASALLRDQRSRLCSTGVRSPASFDLSSDPPPTTCPAQLAQFAHCGNTTDIQQPYNRMSMPHIPNKHQQINTEKPQTHTTAVAGNKRDTRINLTVARLAGTSTFPPRMKHTWAVSEVLTTTQSRPHNDAYLRESSALVASSRSRNRGFRMMAL